MLRSLGALTISCRPLALTIPCRPLASSQCIVLTDRQEASGPNPNRPPIPALLAVGAIHHHLIKTGLRSDTSIVVDTLGCYSTHHAAMLIGYGAHAICPHLAYETCR